MGSRQFMAYAVQTENIKFFGHLANIMYFLVGYHYVKQTYGCAMVTSAAKKVYLSKIECKALWLSMYSLWFLSLTENYSRGNGSSYHSIEIEKIILPNILIGFFTVLTFASLTWFIFLMY